MTKLITALIGIGIAYLLFTSSQFQKAFYPKDYWDHEIQSMIEVVGYVKHKVLITQQKIDVYQSDDIIIVQQLELGILHKELQTWKVMLDADQKRLNLMIEQSAK